MRVGVFRGISACVLTGLVVSLANCTDNTNYFYNIPPKAPDVVVAKPDTVCNCGTGVPVPVPIPPSIDTALSLPRFSIKGSLQHHGQIVTLSADALPPKAVFEYSWDSGKTWNQGDSLILCRSGTISARIRNQGISSREAKETYTLFYKKVLIVGNSITHHSPRADVGWNGSWGMAASKADSDYVHRLTRTLRARYPDVQVRLVDGVPFESNYETYDLKKLDEHAGFRPDLIVMRIAENVTIKNEDVFRERYGAFIKRLTAQTTAKVVCTTSFWPDQFAVIGSIGVVAGQNKYDLVNIGGFFNDKTYTAQGIFKDSGVAMHPSDKGMRAIYEAIMTKL